MHARSLILVFALLTISSCIPFDTRTGTAQPGIPASTSLQTQRAPGRAAPLSFPIENPVVSNSGASSAAVSKTVKVGLLLPLTGRNAELGRAMQDAAAVSLFDRYARLSVAQQSIRVELFPIDTGDSPELARKGMQQAVAGGMEMVIGPIFGDATEAAAPIAVAKHIPVLSFSNNKARGNIAGVYLMGFSPQEQTARVVRYAADAGKKRIAVLVPKSALGDEVLAAAQSVAKETGKISIVVSQYEAQGGGMDAAVTKLAPNNSELSFDALLLAETGAPLQSLLRTLASRGINSSNMQFLGTGMWDDAALLTRTNLDGAWIASSNPDATSQFEKRFRSTYDYSPPRISSLAYDAVALAVTLATSDRPFTGETLTTPRGFVGPANGMFRLRDAATAERGLAVLQIQGNTLQQLSPAPKEF